MGLHIEKFLALFRLLQCPLALVFLIMICWIEAVSHLGASHAGSSAARFLASLFTIPWTGYDLLLYIRARSWGGDFLSQKSTVFKGLRMLGELILTALWLAALVLGSHESNTTLGNSNSAIQTPAVVASVMWILEIIFFFATLLLVAVQTAKRKAGVGMGMGKQEMMDGQA